MRRKRRRVVALLWLTPQGGKSPLTNKRNDYTISGGKKASGIALFAGIWYNCGIGMLVFHPR